MDDKWFKQKQKIAGVTAEDIAARMGRDRSVVSRIYIGRQKMTLDQARIFAEVLNVPLQEVLDHAGIGIEGATFTPGKGFSENDAAPFVHQTSEHARLRDTAIARALGADRPGIDVWRVQTDALIIAGYLPEDFILVDTHAAGSVAAGDVVIAQAYDGQSATATTVLRRFEPPVLVSASTNPHDRRAIVVDGVNTVVRGKVIASWRLP